MTPEEKENLAVSASVITAFLLGWRRIAGAVLSFDAYRAYNRGHKVHAAFSGALGGAFLLDPSWPEDIRAAVRGGGGTAALPAPTPAANFQRVSATMPSDEIMMGNWTVFDVTGNQSAEVAAASKNLKPGTTVAILLGQPNAQPLVFKAKIIPGGAAGRYVAQWVTQKPGGGPQFAEFGPNHVLAIGG